MSRPAVGKVLTDIYIDTRPKKESTVYQTEKYKKKEEAKMT
jgi:hypothetical protein